MASPIRKIEVELLRVGMYVSRLDRPWLETPFLFQGFFVRTQSDIDELRRYCEHVEIDVEQTDATLKPLFHPARIRSNTTPLVSPNGKPGFVIWARLRELFGKKAVEAPPDPVPGEFYKVTATLADELVVARTVHSGSLARGHDEFCRWLTLQKNP